MSAKWNLTCKYEHIMLHSSWRFVKLNLICIIFSYYTRRGWLKIWEWKMRHQKRKGGKCRTRIYGTRKCSTKTAWVENWKSAEHHSWL